MWPSCKILRFNSGIFSTQTLSQNFVIPFSSILKSTSFSCLLSVKGSTNTKTVFCLSFIPYNTWLFSFIIPNFTLPGVTSKTKPVSLDCFIYSTSLTISADIGKDFLLMASSTKLAFLDDNPAQNHDPSIIPTISSASFSTISDQADVVHSYGH